MHRPTAAALLATAALAAAGGGASASAAPAATAPVATAAAKAKPRVTLAPRCYLSGERGTLTGRGFDADASWSAKIRGARRIGGGRTDGRGRIRANFTAPIYRGTRGTRSLTLSVTDGPHVASTTFRLTPLTASFTPTTGDPATLRVRWRVLGLGVPTSRGVYVHYVRPDGTHRRTVRIGTTRGPCGSLRTGPIALFPFTYTYGRWTFQVDASRRYSRATKPRLLLAFDVKKPKRPPAEPPA